MAKDKIERFLQLFTAVESRPSQMIEHVSAYAKPHLLARKGKWNSPAVSLAGSDDVDGDVRPAGTDHVGPGWLANAEARRSTERGKGPQRYTNYPCSHLACGRPLDVGTQRPPPQHVGDQEALPPSKRDGAVGSLQQINPTPDVAERVVNWIQTYLMQQGRSAREGRCGQGDAVKVVVTRMLQLRLFTKRMIPERGPQTGVY